MLCLQAMPAVGEYVLSVRIEQEQEVLYLRQCLLQLQEIVGLLKMVYLFFELSNAVGRGRDRFSQNPMNLSADGLLHLQ